MRSIKLVLLGSILIIAACGQKPTPPQPVPLPAPLPTVETPAPTDATARETEEARPQVPPAEPGVEEAKPGAIAPTPTPPPPAPQPATPPPAPTAPPPTPPAAVTPQPKTVTITMNSQGFSPAEVAIKKGDVVLFKNTGTEAMWPASAVHPSHDVYPEKGGCLGSKFDACKGVKAGESWSFTFNSVGSWSYHDHLSPGLRGKIIVE